MWPVSADRHVSFRSRKRVNSERGPDIAKAAMLTYSVNGPTASIRDRQITHCKRVRWHADLCVNVDLSRTDVLRASAFALLIEYQLLIFDWTVTVDQDRSACKKIFDRQCSWDYLHQ